MTMLTSWLAENFTAWFVQVLVVGAAGALLPFLFRVKDARSRLLFVQAVLVACLVLPLIQPWEHPVIVVDSASDVPEGPGSGLLFEAAGRTSIDWGLILVGIIGLGAAARLAWLAAGYWTITRYRRAATPMYPTPGSVATAQERTGARAMFAVSPDVTSPVTFGALAPVVLVPPAFERMEHAAQCGIACHELIHVRRRDWLVMLVEEIFTALVWFHPAVWWLVSESRLAREQLVDTETVGLTRNTEPYIRALIEVAGKSRRLDLAPAPLFLRRRHLARRMQALLTEVPMSRTRMLVSYGAMLAIVTAAAWATLIAFPLVGQAEIAGPAAGSPQAATEDGFVVRRTGTNYPTQAVERGIEGEVVVDLTFDADGAIIDSDVISGPAELRQAGLQTALVGGYNVTTARTLQVIVGFELDEDGSAPRSDRIVEDVRIVDLAEPAFTRLRERLDPLRGRSQSEAVASLSGLIAEVTPDQWWLSTGTGSSGLGAVLNVHFGERRATIIRNGEVQAAPPPPPPPPPPPSSVGEAVSQNGERLRVSAGVAAANLLQQVPPEYPPLARQARIQGPVLLEVRISAQGTVRSARIISGHALLAGAAADAVLQYIYRPTLLNGQPVDVITTVEVRFELN